MGNWTDLFALALTHALLVIGIRDANGQLVIDYDWGEMECPDEGTKMMKIDIPWGVEGRAYKTLPDGLVIAPSKIEGAGFGVLSEIFIPKFTWLGEYDGELVKMDYQGRTSWYTWLVHRDGENTALIDGFYFHLSSYHRYINAPVRYRDENVSPMECYGKMYYMTSKDIHPGDELLVYYGHKYAMDLDVDINHYFDVPDDYIDFGLNLNNITHRETVEVSGFNLHQVKDLPFEWIAYFIGQIQG